MNLNFINNAVNAVNSRFGSAYFFAQPADSLILWVYFGFYITLLIFIIGYYFYLRSQSKKQKPYKLYAKTWLWPNLSFAVIGLWLVFFRYEQIMVLSWRVWMYALLAVIVAFEGWFFVKRRQELLDEIEKEVDQKRKGKWLPGKKRKK